MFAGALLGGGHSLPSIRAGAASVAQINNRIRSGPDKPVKLMAYGSLQQSYDLVWCFPGVLLTTGSLAFLPGVN